MSLFDRFFGWAFQRPPVHNGLSGLPIPLAILSDSYKATHPFQYPECKKMVAYGEFRAPFEKDKEDERIVFYGIRYIIDNFVSKPWTQWDIDMAEKFFKTHNAGFSAFPFPKDLFQDFVRENKGYFPVKIEALPEGSVIYPHVPVYQITASKKYARLVTFLETILTMVWYPSTVATLSRKVRAAVQDAFDHAVDPEKHFWIETKLQDFGFRGCTTVEQSVVGGVAHLLNFTGTDTMSAAFYAQFELNNGKPVGNSIPATEHSVMTSYKTEKEAIENMIHKFGKGMFACVMDTYDYTNALENILPSIYKKKAEKGGFMVLRPDSGEPVEVVLQALEAAEKVCGVDVNSMGFKVLRGFGVIQGDGIDLKKIKEILDAVIQKGYSPESVTFGMGGGLLQKVNRDSMSFATKLNYIIYADGTERDVMKAPKTDSGKISLPGVLEVRRVNNLPTVFPKKEGTTSSDNMLKVVYNMQPEYGIWDDFETIRNRVNTEWNASPKKYDPLSQEMRKKIDETIKLQRERNQQAMQTE